MSTQTKSKQDARTSYRAVAILTAILGFLATWAFINAIGVTGFQGFALSLALEAILIKGKALLLAGASKGGPLGYAAVIIDTLLNGAGMFAYVDNLDKTELWVAFTKGLAFTGTMDGVYTFIVSMVLGFLLAVTPHYLWQD